MIYSGKVGAPWFLFLFSKQLEASKAATTKDLAQIPTSSNKNKYGPSG